MFLFFALPFYTQNRTLCQDRLGSNLSKVPRISVKQAGGGRFPELEAMMEEDDDDPMSLARRLEDDWLDDEFSDDELLDFRSGWNGPGARNASSFDPLRCKNDHFTKTGSGQT